MTLPPCYNTSEEYLSDVLGFLKTYQWLYNYHNTHILTQNVFEHFPHEWLVFFQNLSNDELNNLSLGVVKDHAPDTLKVFFDKIQAFRPKVILNQYKEDYKISHNCGLGTKKLHEIVSLAPLIHDISTKTNTKFIIDIGAGLGYLSHLLHTHHNYTVLGIEGDEEKVALAYKNQDKFYGNSKGSVNFSHYFITEHSADTLKTLSGNQNSCLVGLHACADLSITILELFTKIDCIKSLVIMPCCYHRIQLEHEEGDKEFFKYFPASAVLKRLFGEFDGCGFIKRPFLRLACQQTSDSFICMTKEQHEQHSRNCLYRAILQEVAETAKCQVKRIKRKSGKSNATLLPDADFAAYLSSLTSTHKLEHFPNSSDKIETPPKIDDEGFQKNMWKKWNEHKSNCYLVEVLTGLQAAIQSICENIVLLDRVEFLKEKGLQCFVEKVTHDRISPRCYALVATRP